MPHESQELLESIVAPLAWFYLAACAMNVAAAFSAARAKFWLRGAAWLALAGLFGVFAAMARGGHPPEMPERLKTAIDAALGPVSFTLGSFAVLSALYVGRRFFVRTWVAWSVLNASLLAMGLSLVDADFAQVVLRGDDLPIVAMTYLLGFFLWLAASQAVENDSRLAGGQPPREADFAEKTLVWPDLVYIELIAMVALSAVLIVWSLSIRAPLEQPANPVVTPNPSKAPWYFLGLQEMLVFFDPAIAGVVLPCLIILGLAAIPYLDFNPKGSGYYTIAQRRFGVPVFLFGFLQLWILLILIGTFFRGPNWNFFGLYAPRDPHRVLPLTNVKLSEYFWAIWLGRGVPQVPPGCEFFRQLIGIAWREIAGLTVLGLYFAGLPLLLGRTVFREMRQAMGRPRYWLMALLLLMMFALPIKMVLRWTMNLSYLVSIPEWFVSF
jgi:hypothetical protein